MAPNVAIIRNRKTRESKERNAAQALEQISEAEASTRELSCGERMERYLVGREIGRGSYGVVYKVTSRVDGQTYVLKKLQTASVPAKEREAQLQEAIYSPWRYIIFHFSP